MSKGKCVSHSTIVWKEQEWPIHPWHSGRSATAGSGEGSEWKWAFPHKESCSQPSALLRVLPLRPYFIDSTAPQVPCHWRQVTLRRKVSTFFKNINRIGARSAQIRVIISSENLLQCPGQGTKLALGVSQTLGGVVRIQSVRLEMPLGWQDACLVCAKSCI